MVSRKKAKQAIHKIIRSLHLWYHFRSEELVLQEEEGMQSCMCSYHCLAFKLTLTTLSNLFLWLEPNENAVNICKCKALQQYKSFYCISPCSTEQQKRFLIYPLRTKRWFGSVLLGNCLCSAISCYFLKFCILEENGDLLKFSLCLWQREVILCAEVDECYLQVRREWRAKAQQKVFSF